MYNTLIIIVIIAVLVAGGFFFWRGFEGVPLQEEKQSRVQDVLVPVSVRGSASASATPVEKIYRQTISIDSRSFFFNPDTFRVKRGEKVTVNVKAFGDHTFTINELNVNVKTPNGKVTKIEFTPQKSGAFRYYCSLPGHKGAGQEGILIVE
ncbi:cupredoxin domain-containing protein [Candidatus Azambacteria bacterium]|nr:cupredoxin domain-containing protein [Candidatus Azambacteria bacterium]